MIARAVVCIALFVSLSTLSVGGTQITPELIRDRTEREWIVKAEKMRQHLLPLMRAHEIDLWIILSRENAPDPALELFGGYGITGWYGHRNAYLFMTQVSRVLRRQRWAPTSVVTSIGFMTQKFFTEKKAYRHTFGNMSMFEAQRGSLLTNRVRSAWLMV